MVAFSRSNVCKELESLATRMMWLTVADAAKILGVRTRELRQLFRQCQISEAELDILLASAKHLGKDGAIGKVFMLENGEVAKVSKQKQAQFNPVVTPADFD
jgi:hypothetical protein